MPPVIKGKDVLNALNELKTPSKLIEIVDHMSANCEGSKTALTAAVKTILEAGVQYGYIQEADDKYYTENLTAENANDEQVQPTTSENKDLYRTELISSSESVEVAKNEKKTATNKRPMTSSKYFLNSSDDEEELRDRDDCCGSRYRRRSRSRSSGKHGKSHSRRRTRRRRRG
ncbi:uncharacterized protein LOC135959135 [Calliphora vicina]|uniref:uncharacterized protein LOC135959135 n=1 Tax=Calliphora vicina TaxID=7373 RepID=UPI00325BD9A2